MPGLSSFGAALEGDTGDPRAVTVPFAESGHVAQDASYYFRLTVPGSHEGLRIAVAADGDCVLRLRRDDPESGPEVASSASKAVHTLFVKPEDAVADDGYYLEIEPATGGALSFEVVADAVYARELTWDDGALPGGAQKVAQPDTVGGSYLYKITTQASQWGAWRNVLEVASGEADLYVAYNDFPESSSERQSTRTGSDGVVLSLSEFNTNRTWHLRVDATPGAEWEIFGGDVHVHDFGMLSAGEVDPEATVEVGPERVAWMRTSVEEGTLAWRLLAADPEAVLYLSDAKAPVPGGNHAPEETQKAQMLVVPPRLSSGQFIVGVEAEPGPLHLDSRVHEILTPSEQGGFAGEDNFRFTVTGESDEDFNYVSYQVDVPEEQIAWEVRASSASGTADVYVRRGAVPTDLRNDALSEAPGDAVDSTVQVPPTLSDGVWYVTLRGEAPFTFELSSGNPEVTDIDFVNVDPPVKNGAEHETRAGWRYFRVSDIDSQLGGMGWVLELANHGSILTRCLLCSLAL